VVETERIIRTFVVDELLPGRRDVPEDVPLLSLLDSADLVSLVSFVEEEFDLTFPPDQVVPENFRSVSALAAFVDRHQGEGSGGGERCPPVG
jgi:acyl carrier protein